MDLQEIKAQAMKEIEEDDFRRAVDAYKLKIKSKKSFWDVLFPYKLIFIKKENDNGN